MAYQSQYQYQQEYDDDSSYNPYHSQAQYPPRSAGGYQVAPISSYPPPLPSPPAHARHNDTGHALPSLPPSNPYYEHQAQRPTTNTTNYGRPPSPTRPQYREEQGQIKMSAYRQHRMAAAADTNTGGYFPQTQHSVVPNPPTRKRGTSVDAQTQVQPFTMPRSPNNVPPVPSNTLLNYGQSPDNGYDPGYYPSDQYTRDIPSNGMAGLAASATAALSRAPRLSVQPTLPTLIIPPSTNPRAPSPYHDDNNGYLSPGEQGQNLYAHANSSRTGLLPAAAPPGLAPIALARHDSNSSYISRSRSPVRSEYQLSEYAPSLEAPNRTIGLGVIDPMEIADDEHDDPFVSPNGKRGFRPSTRASAATGAGAGFLASRSGRDSSGTYGQLPGSSAGSKLGGGGDGNGKSAWMQLSEKRARTRRKRMLWAFGVLAIVAILGVTGAILGPVLKKTLSNSSSDNDDTSTTPTTNNPENYLTASSSEIKALLNNANLHKVFPGMDYTPQNSQYPDCLSSPPSQNNITKDIAILSQLTPLIRLYGTDCNVTDMVLTSLSLLNLDSKDVKIMTGIWLDNNATTNTRQLSQFYTTLSDLHSAGNSDIIAGVMVGNEVLFRADMTETELISTINDVRTNLSSNGFEELPVGTSELGSQWSADLAQAVDMVGANVHPFFAGVTAQIAASWTWSYWQTNDVAVTTPTTTTSTNKTQIIAETGWPTTGGYYLGSTSGITELNTFMDEWVCDALSNGTMYWWFEAFDEGWKRLLDSNSTTDGQVESHWGLFEEGTWGLKSGVTVPDCGGKTAGMVF